MNVEDIQYFIDRLGKLGTNKVVFRDENKQLNPIKAEGINIVGLYVSESGILWAVDDTKVKSDMSGQIRGFYWQDKHLLINFEEDIKHQLIERLDAYAPVDKTTTFKSATVK